jgi:hypothetical protein
MENRAWAPIIVLALIMSGVFAFYYLEKVDKANADFQNAKLITDQAHESLRTRHEMAESRKKLAASYNTMLQKIQAAETRLKSLEQIQADADKKQRSVEGELKYWIGAMPGIRQKVWQAAAGAKLGDLVLQSGKTLKNAEIRKVEEQSISFIHSEGIGTIALDELPKELIARFDLGDASMGRQFAQFQESLAEKPKTAPVVTQTAPAAAPASSGMSAMDEVKLKDLKFRVADLQSKVSAARQNKINWDSQASRISGQISESKSRGVPTTRLREDYQNAQAQAQANAAAVLNYEAELRKVQVELDLLSSKQSR